jgi:hypothetical protein
LRHIVDVLKEADKTITKYQQLLPIIPEFLLWKVYEATNHPYGHRLTGHYRLLSLISLAKGYDYDDIDILVQEDEYDWPFDKFTPYDQEFVHEPFDGVRIATDVYAIQDFVGSFARAVNGWITEEMELGIQEEADSELDDEFSDLGEPISPKQPAVPVIKTIIIKMDKDEPLLHARGRPPLSLPRKLLWFFTPFLKNVADNHPERFVQWPDLYDSLGQTDEDRTKASKKVRNALRDLRKAVNELGRPPDGGLWIVTKKARKGCRLNISCDWRADKAVKSEYGTHGLRGLTDPGTMEENTPDRNQRLPAHPRRKHRKSDGDHSDAKGG